MIRSRKNNVFLQFILMDVAVNRLYKSVPLNDLVAATRTLINLSRNAFVSKITLAAIAVPRC